MDEKRTPADELLDRYVIRARGTDPKLVPFEESLWLELRVYDEGLDTGKLRALLKMWGVLAASALLAHSNAGGHLPIMARAVARTGGPGHAVLPTEWAQRVSDLERIFFERIYNYGGRRLSDNFPRFAPWNGSLCVQVCGQEPHLKVMLPVGVMHACTQRLVALEGLLVARRRCNLRTADPETPMRRQAERPDLFLSRAQDVEGEFQAWRDVFNALDELSQAEEGRARRTSMAGADGSTASAPPG